MGLVKWLGMQLDACRRFPVVIVLNQSIARQGEKPAWWLAPAKTYRKQKKMYCSSPDPSSGRNQIVGRIGGATQSRCLLHCSSLPYQPWLVWSLWLQFDQLKGKNIFVCNIQCFRSRFVFLKLKGEKMEWDICLEDLIPGLIPIYRLADCINEYWRIDRIGEYFRL